MRYYRTVLIIGIIEILIGSITILWNAAAIILGTNTKSPGVLAFVLTAGCVSSLLGVGLLNLKRPAYYVLLYFSSVVLLSKLLIFLGVMQLNGELETIVPGWIKSLTSIIYHSFLIYYLTHSHIRRMFHR